MKLTLCFVIWNLVVFFMYGLDKLKASRKKWRIPENVLLSSAFLFGGIGAIFGMVVFNHKTSKPKFRFVVPLFVLANLIVLLFLLSYFYGSLPLSDIIKINKFS